MLKYSIGTMRVTNLARVSVPEGREVLPKRLGRFGLAVHPEKTHLIRFLPTG
jgi:hypothetical protein